MQHLLSPANREVIAQLAWSNVLLAFDYDGTLAPIVDDPAKATMRTSTRALLEKVAKRYPCAVISGRAQHDTQLWLDGVPVRVVVGNHGLEPSQNAEAFERVVRRWVPALTQALACVDGVVVEDKRYSIAIHYRAARERSKALAAIERAVASLGPARVLGGKLVVNVLPGGAPHKGHALERVRAQLGCDTALYVGDDQTDEDVFAIDQPGLLTSVRVGRSKRSRASFFLAHQAEMDLMLQDLLEARPAPSNARVEPRLAEAREGRLDRAGATPALGSVLKFMRLLWAVHHGLALTSKRMEKTLGITGVQRLVLRIVGKWPGLSAGQLARILHLDPSTLTPVLQRLGKRRLIARRADPRDGRRSLLGLTAAGRALDMPEEGTVEAAVEAALRSAAPGQIEAAEKVLAQIATLLGDTGRAGHEGSASDDVATRRS